MNTRNRKTLSARQRAKLFARAKAGNESSTTTARRASSTVSEDATDFTMLPGYLDLHLYKNIGNALGFENPFFRVHEGRASAVTVIGGATYLNFAAYDYLGLNGHPAVIAAAKSAIDQYGISPSASRIAGGERPIHRSLEAALAAVYGAEDCLLMVSGHATNVATIGHIVGAEDLILLDSEVHNSVVMGAQLSGAQRRIFSHNNLQMLDDLLLASRNKHRRALVVVEGLYSMDGDCADLRTLIDIKKRHRAWLMIDEAHSLGVLGSRGFGIAEHSGVDPSNVDIWMGTLSKTLAACGGYIAGSAELIEYLRFTSGGFLYSVGIPPAIAAAAHAALSTMQQEPERVRLLQNNGKLFLECARDRGLNTGSSVGAAVIPIFCGNSLRTASLAQQLFRRNIHVFPVLPPGVPERSARLRFFVTSEHTEEQIRGCVATIAEEILKLDASGQFSFASP